MDELSISGIIRATEPSADPEAVSGYRVIATLTRQVKIDPKHDDTIEVPASASSVVDATGAFAFAIGGDGALRGPVVVKVAAPDGQQVLVQQFDLRKARRPLSLRVPALQVFTIDPTTDPARGGRLTLTGRVIDIRGIQVGAGVPVILWGVAADDVSRTPRPLVITKTQAGGYFSSDWVSITLTTAFGRVAGSDAIPIQLEDLRMPLRVLLVLEVPNIATPDNDHPPRVPDPVDLTRNPTAFSQDLGRGCIDLCTPNRVIEEFTYTTVVRTSEPEVKGVTLGVRRLVPRRLLAELVQASAMHETMMRGTVSETDVAALKDLTLDVATARTLAAGDHPPAIADIKRAAWLSEFSRVRDLVGAAVGTASVRQLLDADQAIDWDATPTIFEAVTVAHGHILEYREVWRADGYSLGDLLSSLPLAPGQRRQVAVVDWDRRSQTREEELEFEEQLDR